MRHHHEPESESSRRLGPPARSRDFNPSDPHADASDAARALRTIYRHLWLVLLVTAVTGGGVAFLTLREPPSYRADGMIRLVDAQRGLTGQDGFLARSLGGQADPLLSQMQVLLGRAVLGEVVDQEGLRVRMTPGLSSDWFEVVEPPPPGTDIVNLRFDLEGIEAWNETETATGRFGEPVSIGGMTFTFDRPPPVETGALVVLDRESAITALELGLTTEPLPRTDAIRIAYTSHDPHTAQRVVNRVIEVFQEADARAARQHSQRRRAFLEAQLGQADSLLLDAQRALGEARAREGAYSSQERMLAHENALLNLDLQREEMVADRRMHEGMLEGLDAEDPAERNRTLRTLVSAPGIASNPVISRLFGQLVDYQTEYQRLTSGVLRSTEAHPEVQRYQALIASTERELVDAARSHIASLDARIVAFSELRTRIASEIERLPEAEAEEVRLLQHTETLRRVADQIRQDLHGARMAEAIEAGQVEVINLAALPREPENSARTARMAMGLILGLLLGVGGSFLRESFNSSVRHREEVESLAAVPGLAVIPHTGAGRALAGWTASGGNGKGSRRTAIRKLNPDRRTAAASEAFRLLRTNLVHSSQAMNIRTLVITSPAPEDGKTTTAIHLSAALAEQGRKVLLVDCDPHRGCLHRLIGTPRSPGIQDLLRGEVDVDQAIWSTSVPSLFLVPAGSPTPEGEIDTASSQEAWSTVLKELSAGFDRVILDAPPVLATADASVLSTVADGVVLVVRAGRTDRDAVRHAARQLAAIDANVVGGVMNDPDQVVRGYHEYYAAYADTAG